MACARGAAASAGVHGAVLGAEMVVLGAEMVVLGAEEDLALLVETLTASQSDAASPQSEPGAAAWTSRAVADGPHGAAGEAWARVVAACRVVRPDGDAPPPRRTALLLYGGALPIRAALQAAGLVDGPSSTTARAVAVAELLRHIAVSSPRIIDGCACVGGNAISFARHFSGGVVAVELDEARYAMLRHNADVLFGSEARIDAVQGDLFEILSLRDPRFVGAHVCFVDPPWGGREADHALEILFGAETLSDVAFAALSPLSDAGVSVLALKLPMDYDTRTLDAALLRASWRRRHCALRLRKMALCVYAPCRPETHPDATRAGAALAAAPPAARAAYVPPHRR
ncbi:hypothetical protein M885DRAFT_611826 [Pelagophyceae sp. CCMP2097]|nr:hypothetical protein M885DRAFT_611826 [Pelagophyceae sp. CCMP2097]